MSKTERVGDGIDPTEYEDEFEIHNMQQAGILELPKVVKRRVEALKKLQVQNSYMEARYFKELHALDCKYHKLYSKLYEKRKRIVTGIYDPPTDDYSDDEAMAQEYNRERESIVGVPYFWLMAFKNSPLLSAIIRDHDIPVLRYLKDVKTKLFEHPMGFILEFYFSENEFFSNTVLVKEYDMKCEPDPENPYSFDGPQIYKSRGCEINWKPGKNVTVQISKQLQEYVLVPTESFFNFFNPPAVIDGVDQEEEIKEKLMNDFEIGYYIFDTVVPRAVLYYTGEGAVYEGDDDDPLDDDFFSDSS